MFGKKLLRITLVLSAAVGLDFFSTGCTRNVNQTAHISISLPATKGAVSKVNAAPSVLSHVIINVTGSGISSPVALLWDSNGGQNAAPASFPVTVPGGKGRLVQVLAVYNNGTDQFYYGDVTADITADTTLPVTVAQLASGVGEGSVTGKYLTAAGVGPTQPLKIMYTPVGKPKMLIMTTAMVGGFFSSFALSGAGVSYVLADGTDIFGGPLDLATYTPNNVQVSFYIPQNYSQHGSNNSSTYQLQSASTALFGFFGPGATATPHKICYPPTGTPNGIYSDQGVTPITYSPTATGTNSIHVAMAGIEVFQSANLDSQGLCKDNITNDVLYTNYLAVDPALIVNQGFSLAFQGAYQALLQGTWRDPLMVNYSVDGISVSYSYLPGIFASGSTAGVAGTDLLYRVIPSTYSNPGDYQGQNGGSFDCTNLNSLTVPFGAVNNYPVTASSPLAQSTLLTPAPTMAATDTLQVVACPYMNVGGVKTYISGAVESDYNSSQVSTPQGPAMATQFQLADAFGNKNNLATPAALTVAMGACTPLYISGLVSAANATAAPLGLQSMNLGVTTSGGVVYYGGDSTCTTASTPIYGSDLTGLYNTFTVFVSASSSGAINLTDTTSVINSGTAFSTSITGFSPSGTYGTYLIAPTSIYAYSCYPVSLLKTVTYTTTPLAGFGSNLLYGNMPTSNFSYYSDPICSQMTTPSFMFNSNATLSSPLYFRYLSTVSPASLAPSGVSPAPAGVTSATVQAPGPASMLQISTSNTPTTGQCNTIAVQTADATGRASPVPTASPMPFVTVNVGGTGFVYPNTSCTGNGSASAAVPFTSGSPIVTFGYKGTIAGADTISASLSSPFSANVSTPITTSGSSIPVLTMNPTSVYAGSSASFVVTASVASVAPIVFYYNTMNGTAGSGIDYVSTTNTATIPAGVTSLTLPPILTYQSAAGKTFAVGISSLMLGNAAFGMVTAFATVLPQPTINVNSLTGTAGSVAFFVVTISSPFTSDVTFNFTTVNGTAVAPTDYLTTSGAGVISAGLTSMTIGVPTNSSIAGKNMQMMISSPGNAVPGTMIGTGSF